LRTLSTWRAPARRIKDILSFVHLSSHYNSHNLHSHFLLGKALSDFLEGRRVVESGNKAIKELTDFLKNQGDLLALCTIEA